MYFGMYETAKDALSRLLPSATVAIPLAGGISGASAWFFSFPLDCIKAHIQGNPLDRKRRVLSVTKQIWSQKGFRGFYSGIGNSEKKVHPKALLSFEHSSLALCAFPHTRQLILFSLRG